MDRFIQCCCPCLPNSKKKRSSKYSYVQYTASKKQPPPSSRSFESSGKTPKPEQVFEFPQGKQERAMHPQMFMGEGGAITQQPLAGVGGKGLTRFTSQTSTTSTGNEYTEFVVRGGGKTTPTGEEAKGKSKSPSRGRSSGNTPKPGVSLPDLSVAGQGDTRSPLIRRQSYAGTTAAASSADRDPTWMPGLTVLEETSLTQSSSRPMLQFSLHYDVMKCTLTVHLHHSCNLPAKDRRGTSDPFVVLYMMPNKEEIFESKVVFHTLDPVFDQSFEFKKLTTDEICRQTLVFRIYDHDKFTKNDTIGGVLLPLEEADLFGVVMRMEIDENPNLLSDMDSKGDLLFALSYDPVLSIVKGVVLKATNLKKQDVIGLADPYIKIRLLCNKKVISKWKTSIKRNTLIPVFNESFQFNILGIDISDVSLEVLVMDYDRFSKDDVVGRMLFGSNVGGVTQLRHWQEMLSASPQVVSQWHTINTV